MPLHVSYRADAERQKSGTILEAPRPPLHESLDLYFGTDVPNWPPFCFIENDRAAAFIAGSAKNMGETKNLAAAMPEKLAEMQVLLETLITEGRSTPGPKQLNDVTVTRHPSSDARSVNSPE